MPTLRGRGGRRIRWGARDRAARHADRALERSSERGFRAIAQPVPDSATLAPSCSRASSAMCIRQRVAYVIAGSPSVVEAHGPADQARGPLPCRTSASPPGCSHVATRSSASSTTRPTATTWNHSWSGMAGSAIPHGAVSSERQENAPFMRRTCRASLSGSDESSASVTEVPTENRRVRCCCTTEHERATTEHGESCRRRGSWTGAHRQRRPQ